MCMAWFEIPDENSIADFKSRVERDGALYEGSGRDARDNHIECFATFPTKKKMDSFAKRVVKKYPLVGSAD